MPWDTYMRENCSFCLWRPFPLSILKVLGSRNQETWASSVPGGCPLEGILPSMWSSNLWENLQWKSRVKEMKVRNTLTAFKELRICRKWTVMSYVLLLAYFTCPKICPTLRRQICLLSFRCTTVFWEKKPCHWHWNTTNYSKVMPASFKKTI